MVNFKCVKIESGPRGEYLIFIFIINQLILIMCQNLFLITTASIADSYAVNFDLNILLFLQGGPLSCTLIGSIFRHSHERVVAVMADSSQTFLGCLVCFAADQKLAVFFYFLILVRVNLWTYMYKEVGRCYHLIRFFRRFEEMIYSKELNFSVAVPSFSAEILVAHLFWQCHGNH